MSSRDMLLAAIGNATYLIIIVDVTGATFNDSEALNALIIGCNAARTTGIGFRLTGATGVVGRVLQVTGLTGLRHEAVLRASSVRPAGPDNVRMFPPPA